MTDETTDVSTTKTACIVVRNVPLTNVIGFGSDGCNVMMGDHDSVKTRLLRDLPGIIITKCVCHSAHLCSSEACKQLPESVEQLARDIYNFFKHSDKRQFDFRNFQSFAAVEPHKILKPSQTRWLSLLAVVERILEQWEALRLFFIDFTTNPTHREKADVRNRAVFILEKLNNPFYKLYFCFLEWSLPLFNKFNKEFQSEKVVVHNLHGKIRELYQEILLRYLQREYVMRPNLSEIDPENKRHQLHDAALYLGVKVYELLKHPDVVKRPADITHHFPTLMPLIEVVPRIIAPADNAKKQVIDDQWRSLPNAQARYPKGLNEICEPDKFWAHLLKTEDFCELARFALSTLSLPHANADCERVFSKVNLIKTDIRNRLTVETVNGTLLAAEGIKGPTRNGNCVNFEPSKEMYSGHIGSRENGIICVPGTRPGSQPAATGR
ncbi:hypothetical protein K1T71_012051 [Dendrolimus kikuchii]|uniref:Uncharacterized protein n=1 Tax=Dendrolimus kikuchii TaxID=765133 RepID=A0ACC1CKL2_9NEOP|nr:hypothetical protein K1T71_012051 [Dendrolimus kikuchii]